MIILLSLAWMSAFALVKVPSKYVKDRYKLAYVAILGSCTQLWLSNL